MVYKCDVADCTARDQQVPTDHKAEHAIHGKLATAVLSRWRWHAPICKRYNKPSSHCPDETKRQPRDVTLVSYINDVLYVPRNVLIVTTNFFCKIVTTNFISFYRDIDIAMLYVRPSVRPSVRLSVCP